MDIMTPDEAYDFARDHGPSDELREIASKDREWAYYYALYVDKGPHDVTRQGVLNDALYTLWYALDVDMDPRDDTRNAASTQRLRRSVQGLSGDRRRSVPLRIPFSLRMPRTKRSASVQEPAMSGCDCFGRALS
jgi:hypothetical protein